MRNLLLALLLANILYFIYDRFVTKPPEYGVAVVSEDELGPPLELGEPVVVAREGDEDGSGRSTDFAGMTGRSCATVGPFRAESDADDALADVLADGLSATRRSTDGQVFVGHWVQIKNVADRSSGNQMLAQLTEGGLADAYLVETDDEGIKISLGLFEEMARAERVELQAKSLGLPAEIAPRMSDAVVFYVDIGLPPGRGAGSIVSKYGEELVLLRGAATCPGGS